MYHCELSKYDFRFGELKMDDYEIRHVKITIQTYSSTCSLKKIEKSDTFSSWPFDDCSVTRTEYIRKKNYIIKTIITFVRNKIFSRLYLRVRRAFFTSPFSNIFSSTLSVFVTQNAVKLDKRRIKRLQIAVAGQSEFYRRCAINK